MTVWSAILQGILQGLTEFLPVSSSGHLSLYQAFTGQSGEEAFFLSIVLHGGTMAAVLFCFREQIRELLWAFLSLVRDVFSKEKAAKTSPKQTLLCLMVSCVPLLAAPLFAEFVRGFSTDKDITVEGFCFLMTGILLLTASGFNGKKDGRQITYQDALAVGFGQLCALMPGISRSGTTVCVGRMRGMTREYAVSYSFILGLPTMGAAMVLETAKALEQGLSTPLFILAAGFGASLVSGMAAIRLVQWLVRGDKFKYFGYYTLGLGVVVLTVGFLR